MEEIKVNEYVKTKRGEICKVLGVRQELREGKRVYGHLAYYLDNHKGSLTPAFIVKHSPNIIDLIEVGDYVNGKKVQEKIGNMFLEASSSDLGNNRIFDYMIKSIVTKEMFNQVKYEV